MARVTAVTAGSIISTTNFGNALITDYLSQTDTAVQTITSDLVKGTTKAGRTITNETLAAGVATFAVIGEAMRITGDALANVVTTITGGRAGQILILTFVDALVTITDTDGHTANTVDLVGVATNFVSADDTMLTLFFDGTSWYELFRSVN